VAKLQYDQDMTLQKGMSLDVL